MKYNDNKIANVKNNPEAIRAQMLGNWLNNLNKSKDRIRDAQYNTQAS